MNTVGVFAHSRRILDTALDESDSSAMIGMTVGMLLLAAVGLIGCIIYMKSVPLGIMRGAGIPLSILALFAWLRFATGAAVQNQPANACLVPGLNQRVRTTAALAWCVTMLPLTAVGLSGEDGMVFVLAASAAVTSIGLYRLGRPVFLYAAMAALWIMVYGQGALFMAGSPYRGLALGALALACLAFAAYGLMTGFPRGGSRHWDMLAPHAEIKAKDKFSLGQLQRKGGRRPVYAMVLKRDSGTPSLRRHLLMHAIGPVGQRLAFALPFVVCLLVVVAARPVSDLLGLPFERLGSILAGVLSGGLLGLGVIWTRFATSFWATDAEQALVRLTPAMPTARNLNRELGAQLLRTCLVEWAAIAVVMLAAVTLWFGGGTALQVATAISLGILPGTGVALGNYANREAFTLAPVVMAEISSLILLVISLFVMKNMIAWSCMMALMLMQSVATIRYCWSKMMAAPVAFPAGRMA